MSDKYGGMNYSPIKPTEPLSEILYLLRMQELGRNAAWYEQELESTQERLEEAERRHKHEMFMAHYRNYERSCDKDNAFGLSSIQRICGLNYTRAEAFRNKGLELGLFEVDKGRNWLFRFSNQNTDKGKITIEPECKRKQTQSALCGVIPSYSWPKTDDLV